MRGSITPVVWVFVGLTILVGAALADVEGAKKYLDEAARHVKEGQARKAQTALDLAEAELEGVPESDAAALRQQLQALRRELSSANDDARRKELARQVGNQLQRIKSDLDDERWLNADEKTSQLEEFLNDPENKKLLGDEADAFLKQLAPLRRVAVNRLLGDKIERVDTAIAASEEEWPKLIDEILGKDTPSSREYSTRAGSDRLDRLTKMLQDLPADNQQVQALAQRVEKLKSEYASAASSGSATAAIDRVASRVQGVEEDWPGLMETIRDPERTGPADSAARDAYNKLEMLDGLIRDLPDDPRTADLTARASKLRAEFDSVYASAGTARVAERLARWWDEGKERWQGWESEATGPSFTDYAMNGGDSDARRFNMPRTIALRQQADRFLESIRDMEDYKSTAEAPPVKSIVDEVTRLRGEAYAKVLKATTTVVEQAENEELNEFAKLHAVQYMESALTDALGSESPEARALMERNSAILKKHQAAVAAAEKAQEEAFQRMCESAEKAWPAMAARFADARDGFDPDNPPVGATVRFRDINNRMGWDYDSESHGFASRVNGKPFAGKFDPVVLAAIQEVRAKLPYGRMGDNGWDVIGIVEPGTVRITERVKSEVRSSSGSSIGSVERWDPIDVPHIRIVAVHAGPVAVAVGVGASKEDGSIEQPGSATRGSSAGGSSLLAQGGGGGAGMAWLRRVVMLFAGLSAGAVCLLRAGYAPLVAEPQVGSVQSRLGAEHLAIVGLICAGVGVLLMIWGYVIFGLLTNLAIIAAGLYAGMDWLIGRNLVKPEQADRVRGFGVPIGLACVGLVLVSFLTGLMGLRLFVI